MNIVYLCHIQLEYHLAAVTIGFESSTITAMEEEGYINITLQKSGTTLVDSCIQLTTGDESAIGTHTNQFLAIVVLCFVFNCFSAGIDYLSTSSELTFTPEEAERIIIVPLFNNDITESTRNFSAFLTPLSRCAGVNVAMEDQNGHCINY